MIDKGKYSSHGAMIKKLPNFGLAKWEKSKLAVINPIPSTVPRQKKDQFKEKKEDINVNSKAINAIFRFQQKIKFKPLQEDLVKPFLYIEQVMKKLKVQDLDFKNAKPFVTSSNIRPSSSHVASAQNKNITQNHSQVPSGYLNLFQYEEDKRRTAKKLFTKLMNVEIANLKDFYLMWNKRADQKTNPEIFVRESQFLDFMKELVHNNISDKLLKHFFQLYKNKDGKVIKRAVKDNNNSSVVKDRQSRVKQKDENAQKSQKFERYDKLPNSIKMGIGMLSIKALAFNYDKYVKSEVQITNIMSEKALKERYTWVKRYLTLFDQSYAQLKHGMNSIRAYEQSLRQHFKAMYNSYKNPFEQQIAQLQKQLQKPIIKYDKHKKDTITAKIEELEEKNRNNYANITQDYEKFMDNFEQTIVKNHDLFFNKRTICKLVLPILHKTTYLNKELLQKEIQVEQDKKSKYIECLSNLIVEIDHDKKFLGQDVFTLADLVELVLSKFNKHTKTSKLSKSNKFQNNFNEFQELGEQFVLKSMKKLIKEIKKQYLLKNQLYVEDIDQFPADQQIPMQLLHTCFEMQCTKVLAKNHIWNELINLIPQITVDSKLHQQKITCNQCLGYLKKYFLKLDENSQIQRNKSKEISLLIENAKLQDLWYYNDIVEKVNRKMNNFNEDLDDEDQKEDDVPQLNKPKRVNFLDVAESYIEKDNKRIIEGESQENKQRSNPYNHEQNIVAKDILKAIFNQKVTTSIKAQDKPHSSMSFGTGNTPRKVSDIPQSLQALKTMSRSFIVPEKDKKLSTNAFDIRFYQKIKEKQQQEEELYRLGTSALLSHLPKPQELQVPQNDPLKISTFLQKSITNFALQQQKVLQNKFYQSNVQQGVDSNYYREKIKLENRPTRYDSDGKSKYSVLFPVGYYEGLLANEPEHRDEKWYLRPHHVETLTENPLSKKDNLIRTEYESKLDRIPLKKRPDEFIIEENVQRKDMLIQSLEQRIQSLKSNLQKAQSGQKSKNDEGQKVPTSILNKYLTGITEGKQDKDLEMATYEAVLYDLRRNEKSMLVDYRDKKSMVDGQPGDKWWERKDGGFNVELRKDRLMVADSLRSGSPHKQFVEKLKNKEIY